MCKEQSNEKAVALQTQPDSSYGLPLETGCPSCPALLQLFLLLFLKAESQIQQSFCVLVNTHS